MNYRKTLKVVSLLSMLCLIMPVTLIWAGGGPEQPSNGTIEGPEVWGTVIVDCGANAVYIRAKRIVECVVETQAVVFTSDSALCPSDLDETSPLHEIHGLSGSLFGIPGRPIVTKVKNFKQDTGDGIFNIYSFDAQIKFFHETTQ